MQICNVSIPPIIFTGRMPLLPPNQQFQSWVMKLVWVPGTYKNHCICVQRLLSGNFCLVNSSLWQILTHIQLVWICLKRKKLGLELRNMWLKFDCNNDKQLHGIVLFEQTRNMLQTKSTHTHTTVLRLCGFCPGEPGWAGTRTNKEQMGTKWTWHLTWCY